MSSVVLDASAVLAVLRKERGAEVVAPVLNGALMSAVNYSEVLKKSVEIGGSMDLARLFLKQCEVKVVDFDSEQALLAAGLYPPTSGQGLSFADRACLALGMSRAGIVFTCEAKFGELELPVQVTLIRQRL